MFTYEKSPKEPAGSPAGFFFQYSTMQSAWFNDARL